MNKIQPNDNKQLRPRVSEEIPPTLNQLQMTGFPQSGHQSAAAQREEQTGLSAPISYGIIRGEPTQTNIVSPPISDLREEYTNILNQSNSNPKDLKDLLKHKIDKKIHTSAKRLLTILNENTDGNIFVRAIAEKKAIFFKALSLIIGLALLLPGLPALWIPLIPTGLYLLAILRSLVFKSSRLLPDYKKDLAQSLRFKDGFDPSEIHTLRAELAETKVLRNEVLQQMAADKESLKSAYPNIGEKWEVSEKVSSALEIIDLLNLPTVKRDDPSSPEGVVNYVNNLNLEPLKKNDQLKSLATKKIELGIEIKQLKAKTEESLKSFLKKDFKFYYVKTFIPVFMGVVGLVCAMVLSSPVFWAVFAIYFYYLICKMVNADQRLSKPKDKITESLALRKVNMFWVPNFVAQRDDLCPIEIKGLMKDISKVKKELEQVNKDIKKESKKFAHDFDQYLKSRGMEPEYSCKELLQALDPYPSFKSQFGFFGIETATAAESESIPTATLEPSMPTPTTTVSSALSLQSDQTKLDYTSASVVKSLSQEGTMLVKVPSRKKARKIVCSDPKSTIDQLHKTLKKDYPWITKNYLKTMVDNAADHVELCQSLHGLITGTNSHVFECLLSYTKSDNLAHLIHASHCSLVA